MSYNPSIILTMMQNHGDGRMSEHIAKITLFTY